LADKRIILLVDMDYFYAACEELRRDGIRGKPVIVGADPKNGKGRGVVMTCNYEARKYGIRSAMPISIAYRVKPDAIFLPMDYPYYEEMSNKVMLVLKEFADGFEQVSIDEAYLDISSKVSSFDDAAKYAKTIKDDVKNRAGLPCSIGVSFNKLLAKMASDAAKPNGVKVITEKDVHAFLDDMPVRKLYSVGEKTGERLEAMGYGTIGKLAKANKMELIAEFGSVGLELHNYANGIDESPLLQTMPAKSVGREMTFEEDTADRKEVEKGMRKLSDEVAAEAQKLGFVFRTISVKLRYGDFSEKLKSRSVKPTGDAEELYDTAVRLYAENAEKGRKLRKIGVRVSGFIQYGKQSRLG
jgi:nucleotidyltransferase/DNA polymerase involved in DNA repair